MATTAPLPSPAPSLTTPHLPGFFPSTPSPSAYAQSEGPLEAAGRSLSPADDELIRGTTSSSAAPALLGAAAGMLVGGVGGAIAGASLFSVDKWEREGLQKKAQMAHKPTGKENQPTVAPAAPPAASKPVAVAGEAHLVPASAGAGAGEFVALDANNETRAETPTQPQDDATTPTEEKPSSDKKELAGAAVVGAGAGALGATALDRSAEDKAHFAEPVHNASNHRTANDQAAAASSSTPAPAAVPATAAVAAYPVVGAEQETIQPDAEPLAEEKEEEEEEEAEEPKKDKGKGKEIAEVAVGGAAVGAGAVAVDEYLNDKEDATVEPALDGKLDNAAVIPPPSADTTKADTASTILEQDPSPVTHQTTVIEDTRPPVSELLAAEKEQEEQQETSAAPTPRDALNDELDESVLVHGGSRFYEQLDDTTPKKPVLVSRFSDATVDTTANTTAASTPFIDEQDDPFDGQRAAVLNAALIGFGQSPNGRKLGKDDLQTKELPLEETGFAKSDHPTDAQLAFAHLSSPASTSPVVASAPVDEQASEETNRAVPVAAAVGLAGIGAGTFAYAEHKENDNVGGDNSAASADQWSTRPVAPDSVATTPAATNTPPPSVPARSPKRDLTRAALGASAVPITDTGANTPSSTRAYRGSPPPSLVGVESFLNDSRNAPQESEEEEQEQEGEYRHEEQVPPVAAAAAFPTGAGDDGRPVVRSPHAKIATRKDSIGHNKLHKKSIRVAPGAPPREGTSSPLSSAGGSQRAQSPALRTGSPSHSPVVPAGGRSRSGSVGNDLWDNSVANVVNEETAHRNGHRPQLVTIESEDRRDNVMDRWIGVQDPTAQSHSSNGSSGSPRSIRSQHTQTQRHVRNTSTSSNHGQSTYRPGSPAVAEAQQAHSPNKLHKERRRSNASESGGFLGRVFGHKKSPSQDGGAEGRRGSGDYQRQ